MKSGLSFHARRLGYSTGWNDIHFNGGVLFANDTPKAHDFFRLWNKLYQEGAGKGVVYDQPSLNEANAQMEGVITELDGSFNVQLKYGLRFYTQAKVMHYAGYRPERVYADTTPCSLCDRRVFERIKKEKQITEEIMDMIDHPLESLKPAIVIPYDCIAYHLLNSEHFKALKFLYVKLRPLFLLFEKIYAALYRVWKRRVQTEQKSQ